MIHNYCWRLSLTQCERRYDELEHRLATAPVITVPTITIGSDFEGASYAKKFSGKHSHRVLDWHHP